MKNKILKSIDDFTNTCYTMFKIGAGDFAKDNFPKIVENFWNNEKTDIENLKSIKNAFETEKKIQKIQGNSNLVTIIECFQEGWLDKINITNI